MRYPEYIRVGWRFFPGWVYPGAMASRLRKGRLGVCLGWVDGYLRVVCGAVIGNSGDLGLERARF